MARRRWLGMVAVIDTRAFFGGEGYRRMTVAETMSASPSRGEEWFFNFKRMGQKSKISWPTIFLNGV